VHKLEGRSQGFEGGEEGIKTMGGVYEGLVGAKPP